MFSALYHAVGHVSTKVADIAGHPASQIAVVVACVAWLLTGGTENVLANTMTIGSVVLTQMVLNQQRRRENALHLKIDEMILAMHGTRDEVAGIEHATEAEIEELRKRDHS